MVTSVWQRDIGSDINGVKTTYTSWDACMSKAYCKWPAIIGIVIGSLIVLSLVWCLARCLCCGVECCCGCLSCCNACCPSPRRRNHSNNQGYQQAPPTPYQSSPWPTQYQSPQPMHASGGLGYRSAHAPRTATFDAPTKSAKFNEDALPAMPSWGNATSRRVEYPAEEEVEEVEMEKLDHAPQHHQQDGSQVYGASRNETQEFRQRNDLHHQQQDNGYFYGAGGNRTQEFGPRNGLHHQQEDDLLSRQDSSQFYGSDRNARQNLEREQSLVTMPAMPASPYHNYSQHQQFVPSPSPSLNRGASPLPSLNHGASPLPSPNYGAPSPYAPTYHQNAAPAPAPYAASNNDYYSAGAHQYGGQQRSYEPSIPPSYHTRPPSDVVSPVSPSGGQQSPWPGQQQTYQPFNGSGAGRKPVQGSWREV